MRGATIKIKPEEFKFTTNLKKSGSAYQHEITYR
jgi:hypothetical protein